MRKLSSTFLFILIIVSSFAQHKTQFGIYSEGGWFFPGKIMDTAPPFKDEFAAGVGIYVSTPVWGKLSVSLGAGYRYKFNRQEGLTTGVYNPPYVYEDDHSPYGYGYDPGSYYGYDTSHNEWDSFPQNYIVIPLKLKYCFGQLVFVESGLEASRLLNYKYVTEDTEFNWLVGVGCSKYRLQFALEYVQGFKDQGFGDVEDYPELGEFFRNRMLVLNLSYPILGK